jgi:hypothetical protein
MCGHSLQQIIRFLIFPHLSIIDFELAYEYDDLIELLPVTAQSPILRRLFK